MKDISHPMLSVEEARERVLSFFHVLEPERVPLLEALGRVLADDVLADVDIPPHANTAMDGYAVRADDTRGASAGNPRRLQVIADLAAGYVSETEVVPGTAIRIMTGAPIPKGADAVVRFEDTTQQGDQVLIQVEVPVGENVRLAGEDLRRGTLAVGRGKRLRPQEIGMLATVGCKDVPVSRRPRVAILATGDEVLDIDAPLTPGKIRNSNSFSNAAQVLQCGGIPVMLGIARDQEADLSRKIRAGLQQNVDLFLTSGGVSVGDFDVVKQVLAAEGDITFWRVRMKPGKPFAFGQIGGVPFLGMPGNPVSTMISFELFGRPALLKMQGAPGFERPLLSAALVDGITDKDDRRHYVRVRVEPDGKGGHLAHLTGEQGSGILSSMVQANGVAIVAEDVRSVPAGTPVPVMMLDWE